jgi:DNA ligase-1
MKLAQLVETSAALTRTRSRNEKTALLAELLRRLEPTERRAGAMYLAGLIRQGKIGVGYAALEEARAVPAAAAPEIEIAEVDRAFAELTGESGAGSKGRRRDRLAALLSRATAAEQSFLVRLIAGELRQGASEGLLLEGIAAASGIPATRVRTAAMVAGDLGEVAERALGGGAAALGELQVTLFQPILPMLARPIETVEGVYETFDDVALELKLDGARVQAHKDGDEVRVYSRGLRDITASVPEVVAAVRAMPARSAILDGEAIALRADGRPHRFQTTMSRFSKKDNHGAGAAAGPPLSSLFFDAIYLDGDSLLERPAGERFAALAEAAPAVHRVERIVPASPEEARAFVHRALERGHEGTMAKSLASIYEAGARGTCWLKLKPVHTLDLVVLAAEWGSGRRRGWLSNLHLGARDPATGGFVMLGKTFKGLTDEILAWQTTELLAHEIGREGHIVFVRPELVVEIAAGGVLASPRYPGGLALRFARVRRYRADKRPADADSIDAVRAIYAAGGG